MKLSIWYTINDKRFEKTLNLSRAQWSDQTTDWKKLCLNILGFENTMEVAQYSRKGSVIEVTLANRKDFSLSSDILFKIARYLEPDTYQKLWVASTLLMDIEYEKHGFDVHNLNPGFWLSGRMTDSQRQSAIEALDVEANQKTLLAMINTWLSSEAGVDDFYAWMDDFANVFIKWFESREHHSLELKAIYGLVAPISLLWQDIIDSGQSVDFELVLHYVEDAYPTVGASLQATYAVLCTIYNEDALDEAFWEANTKSPYYYNLQGLDLHELFMNSVNLEKAYFAGANLRNACLARAILNHAVFKNAHLEGADLSDAKLEQACFENAELDEIRCERANFTMANFTGACLMNADLSYGYFFQTNFKEANLQGASFESANCNCLNFSAALLAGASFKGAYQSVDNMGLAFTEQQVWLRFAGANFLGAQCDSEFIEKRLSDAKHESFAATLEQIKTAGLSGLVRIQELIDCEGSIFNKSASIIDKVTLFIRSDKLSLLLGSKQALLNAIAARRRTLEDEALVKTQDLAP